MSEVKFTKEQLENTNRLMNTFRECCMEVSGSEQMEENIDLAAKEIASCTRLTQEQIRQILRKHLL